MSSTSFTADLEDMFFVLFDQLNIDEELTKIEQYSEYDEDTYRTMIEEAYRVATDVLDPINGPGDIEGCHFDNETGVTTPKGFKEAWDACVEGGWVSVTAPPDAGGIGLPAVMASVVSELFSGSAMAFTMYMGLTAAAARIVHQFMGNWDFGPMVAEKMFTGEWGGTMCLTEGGAGSDVGANRCKAAPTDEEGIYLLEGEKIYISGGDQDLTDNIIQLVLARVPDAPAGTKGLGLFMVPKFLFDSDGNLGERNDIRVAGIEEKMGIHGSSTCTLALGAMGPCKGWLIGSESDGIRIMFQMMNEARIGVGTQGLAVGSAAFQYARHYVHERVQGADIDKFRDAEAPRVPIVVHPDVRRMLMNMKVQVEAMRSLCMRIAHLFDLAEHHPDESLREGYMNQVDLLVPILKSHCTDVGFEVAVTGVQVYGGYGYTGEYPVEQLVRDGKIMSIYEGTNGIQAMDLVGRKLRQKNGALFMEWMEKANALMATAGENGLGDDAAPIAKAIQHLGATAMHLGGLGMQGKLEDAMLQATPFQTMFGIVQLGIETVDQAIVAKKKMTAEGETAFLKGKLLNMKYYGSQFIPQAIAHGKAIQSGDNTPMDESLFQA